MKSSLVPAAALLGVSVMFADGEPRLADSGKFALPADTMTCTGCDEEWVEDEIWKHELEEPVASTVCGITCGGPVECDAPSGCRSPQVLDMEQQQAAFYNLVQMPLLEGIEAEDGFLDFLPVLSSRGSGHSGYHEWEQGVAYSCSSHKGCGTTQMEQEQALEAIEADDYARLLSAVHESKGLIRPNRERGLLQFANCNGSIHAQVQFDVAAFDLAVANSTK